MREAKGLEALRPLVSETLVFGAGVGTIEGLQMFPAADDWRGDAVTRVALGGV
ncbi:MAG: hypothetical protein JOZ07_14915 [Solirubrobacterales bacterium]|nr:hypothetical protein [Solirubrobacterales bacterium]